MVMSLGKGNTRTLETQRLLYLHNIRKCFLYNPLQDGLSSTAAINGCLFTYQISSLQCFPFLPSLTCTRELFLFPEFIIIALGDGSNGRPKGKGPIAASTETFEEYRTRKQRGVHPRSIGQGWYTLQGQWGRTGIVLGQSVGRWTHYSYERKLNQEKEFCVV